MHGTTWEQVSARWGADRSSLLPIDNRAPYPYSDDELRKVASDAFVSWQGSRYSVPWQYAGKQVWVRDYNHDVEIRYGAERIATHSRAARKHLIVKQADHHTGIPMSARRRESKTLVHLRQTAPVVEIRPLAAYESVAAGGVR